MPGNPYDEFAYRCAPIEWTSPERLALASALHGGPKPPLDCYRVLELGCGDGANLLPMAYFRRHAKFVGIDGASTQVDTALAHRSALALSNLEFVHADFRRADENLSGKFDFIIAHGIISWVPDEVRDILLELCASRLQPAGLLYLNYNTKPGWNIRGMVREFLCAHTHSTAGLRDRARVAKEVSARIARFLSNNEDNYSRLLANEFEFVSESDASYVAHEFLAPYNRAYWRSEFLELARQYGLEYVADADFNYPSGRVSLVYKSDLFQAEMTDRSIDETADLLTYRQLHSPILAFAPLANAAPEAVEFADLIIASCLVPCAKEGIKHPLFRHSSGFEVEAKEALMGDALAKLQRLWPRGIRVGDIFNDVPYVVDDLKLLHRNGLIELRHVEPGDFDICPEALYKLESQANGGAYVTTPYHVRASAPVISRHPD